MINKTTLALITISACFVVSTYAMRDPKEFESPYFPTGDFVITMPDNSETTQQNQSLLSWIKRLIFPGDSATSQQNLESPSECVTRLAQTLERDEEVFNKLLSRRQEQDKEIKMLLDEVEKELDELAMLEGKREKSLNEIGKELVNTTRSLDKIKLGNNI